MAVLDRFYCSCFCKIFTVCNEILTFKNLQEGNQIFKMAAPIGVFEVRILIMDCYKFLILHQILIRFVVDCIV